MISISAIFLTLFCHRSIFFDRLSHLAEPILHRNSANFLKMAVAAAGIAILPHPAAGDYFTAMEKCANEPSTQERIACANAVAKEEQAKKLKEAGQTQSYGSGNVGSGGNIGFSPDSRPPPQKIWEYTLKAETWIEGPSYSYRPSIVFRCTHGEMLGYVKIGMAVAPDRLSHSAGYTDAILQVDRERAFRVELRISEDGRRLYFPSSIEISKSVSGKQSLTVQVTPYDTAPTKSTFDVGRFDEGIAPLRRACKW